MNTAWKKQEIGEELSEAFKENLIFMKKKENHFMDFKN
jgi:hypothetical protein